MKKRKFSEYPDVLNVKELCEMLGGVGPKTVYRLIREEQVRSFKMGRGFLISKSSVIDYIDGRQPV